jgi:hypothetical protein
MLLIVFVFGVTCVKIDASAAKPLNVSDSHLSVCIVVVPVLNDRIVHFFFWFFWRRFLTPKLFTFVFAYNRHWFWLLRAEAVTLLIVS